MTPSVPDLIAAPQIAVLHVLDTALESTVTALTAAHADLLWELEDGFQFERWSDRGLARVAKDILKRAGGLRAAITAYQPDVTPPWESAEVQLQLAFEEDGPPF